MSEKEYGKLTLDQFRDVVKKLPEIRGQMNELPVFCLASGQVLPTELIQNLNSITANICS